MAYFQKHPREIFPFDLGQCDTIQLWARCDLRIIPLTIDPVQVTAVSKTSFTFTALPEHFDPPGSTITFSIVERRGAIFVLQKGRALRDDEGSVLDRATAIAGWITWAQQAENLRRAVDPVYGFIRDIFRPPFFR
jgi:hypothetical protein